MGKSTKDSCIFTPLPPSSAFQGPLPEMYEIRNLIHIAIVYRANLYLIWPNHKCTIVIQSHAKTNEDKDSAQ